MICCSEDPLLLCYIHQFASLWERETFYGQFGNVGRGVIVR